MNPSWLGLHGNSKVSRWRSWAGVFCVSAFLASIWAAEPELNPVILKEVEDLVMMERMPNDVLWPRFAELQKNPNKVYAEREYNRIRPEYEQRLHAEIRTLPGIKPYLLNLLDKSYRVHPHPEVHKVLDAMGEREDLTPADVEIVSSKVADNLANPVLDYEKGGLRVFQKEFLSSAMSVLARDLNPKNEDLLLQALAWPHASNVNASSAKVLAKAGVAKAVPVMQAAAERIAAHGDSYTANFIRGELAKLKVKLAAKAATALESSPPESIPAPASFPPLSATSPVPVAPAVLPAPRAPVWPWAIGIAVLLLIGALALAWRAR